MSEEVKEATKGPRKITSSKDAFRKKWADKKTMLTSKEYKN